MKKLTLFSVLGVLLLTGCQSMTYSIDPKLGTASGAPSGKAIKQVEIVRTSHYLWWGLVDVNTPDINQLAKTRMNSNQILSNIVIEEKNTFLNGVCACFTYGIYRPRTIVVTGNIYQKEAF